MSIRKKDVYNLLEELNENETELAYKFLRKIVHSDEEPTDLTEVIKEDAVEWESVKNDMENNSAAIHSNGFLIEILKDLVSQGYSGDELVEQFELKSSNIQIAIEKMLDEANQIAAGAKKAANYKDIFGSEA